MSNTTEKKAIDKVTVTNLGMAFRMVGIQCDDDVIDKIIDLVELIEEKGDQTSIKDISELEQEWKSTKELIKKLDEK